MDLVNKLTILTISIIFLCSCTGNREMAYAYDDFDANEDRRIDQEEFDKVFSEQGEFDKWDVDEDRRLTEEEWNTGFNNYGSSYPYEEKGLFDDWDTDGDTYVDDEEFNEGFFDLFDADDSDDITEKEWLDN